MKNPFEAFKNSSPGHKVIIVTVTLLIVAAIIFCLW